MQNIFETERLILRHINPDTDFEPWAEISADPAAMRFFRRGCDGWRLGAAEYGTGDRSSTHTRL